jgi:hypothetical protein
VRLLFPYSFVMVAAFCGCSAPGQLMPPEVATHTTDSGFLYAQPQTHMPTRHGDVPRPPSLDQMPTPGADSTSKPDPAGLQNEARELLELAQALQPDIESVNHGVLPKDAIQKLKRIEKLSKHLRQEIAP